MKYKVICIIYFRGTVKGLK